MLLHPCSFFSRRAVVALFAAALCSVASSATALTYDLTTLISGDTVAVTLELTDTAQGVLVTVSVPSGEGDLRGVFGNVGEESLVGGMGILDPNGVVTQWKFSANKVHKVGAGNKTNPVDGWDWGVALDAQGGGGGALETASFTLTGVTVADLLAAANDGWLLGVRVQETLGLENSGKMGLLDGTPPLEDPPSISITSPVDGAVIASSTVTVSGTVGGTTPIVDVNGVLATVTGSAFTVDLGLADGTHTLTATATNALGSASDSIVVTTDSTPPTVTIDTPTPGLLTNQSTLVVSGTVSDAHGTGTVDINGTSFPLSGGAYSGTVTLAEGTNTVTVIATDGFGNIGQASVTVELDSVAPTIAITSPPDGTLTTLAMVTANGTVTDASGIASVDVNGIVANLSGSDWDAAAPLSVGANTVLATATDLAGNTATASILVTRGAAPTVAITSPAPGSIVGTATVTVTGSHTDATSVDVSGVAATITGGTWAAAVPLTPGSNTLTATATNAFGQAQAQVSLTLDADAPVLQITAPTDDTALTASTVVVSGTVADATATTVTVNGVNATVTGGTFSAAVPLTLGSNTLTATATDAAGNVATDAVTVLHGIAPTVAITSPAPGSIVGTATVTVTGTHTDAASVDVSGVAATITGGTWTATVPLAPGANTLTATATNAFGQAQAQVSLTLDADAPVLQITAPADGAVLTATSVVVSGTVADATATTVTVNGVTATVSGGTFSATVLLGLGSNTLTATATDAAGNVATDAVTVLHGIAPTIAITAPADGTLTTDATITVDGTHTDAGSIDVNGVVATITGATWTATVPLTPGVNTLTATATNGFGQSQAQINVALDADAPVVQATAPADGAVVAGGPITVTGTVTDASTTTVDVNGVTATVSGGTFTASVPLVEGSNTITVTATDAAGNTGTDTLTVISDTVAPAIAITSPADGATVPSATTTVTASVMDAAGISSVVIGGVVATDQGGGVYTADVTLASGVNTVDAVATDLAGNTASAQIQLTLSSSPQITSAPVTTATEDQAYTYDVDAVDPNPAETLSYAILSGPAGLAIDSGTGLISWTPSDSQVGGHFVLVEAQNTQGVSDTQLYGIDVANTGDAPAFVSNPPILVAVDDLWEYTADAQDPDPGDSATVSFSSGPAGMSFAFGTASWTPTAADLGPHTVTLVATDSTGLTATQTFTVTVVSGTPLAVAPALGLEVGSTADGAALVAFSSQSFGAPDLAIDGNINTAWQTAQGSTTDQFLQVDLAGDLVVFDRFDLKTNPGTYAVQNFEVRVSTTGTAPGDFTTVFTGVHSDDGQLHTYAIPPVQARYVELYLIDTYGTNDRIIVQDFSLYTRAREGAIVSLAGTAIATSSERAPHLGGAAAIDRTVNSWYSASPANEWLKVELANGLVHRVGSVQIHGTASPTSLRDFEIAVSTTTSDDAAFTTVFTGSVAAGGGYQNFSFPEVDARYIRLTALNNHGDANWITVETFHTFSTIQGGERVPFDDLTDDDPADPPVAFHWDFGDGNSVERAAPDAQLRGPGHLHGDLRDDPGQWAPQYDRAALHGPPSARCFVHLVESRSARAGERVLHLDLHVCQRRDHREPLRFRSLRRDSAGYGDDALLPGRRSLRRAAPGDRRPPVDLHGDADDQHPQPDPDAERGPRPQPGLGHGDAPGEHGGRCPR